MTGLELKSFTLNLKQMQKLIDDIALFFEFKYPDNMLLENNKEYDVFNQCKEIALKLDMDQLKYHLAHDYVLFLECYYWRYLFLERKTANWHELNRTLLRILDDGTLNKWDLEGLVMEHFLNDGEGIETIEDLFVRLRKENNGVDTLEVERCIMSHKKDIQMRNMVLKLIPFRLIYSSRSSPMLGYERAKNFMRMFEKEYDIHFDTEELEEIMNRDYSEKKKVCKVKKSRRK